MKQHINSQQWNELSKVAQRKVEDLFNPETEPELRWAVHYFQINIGWMIEFLNESGEYSLLKVHSEVLGLPHNWGVGIIKDYNLGEGWVENEYIIKYQENVELCDALWEAVKKELEKE